MARKAGLLQLRRGCLYRLARCHPGIIYLDPENWLKGSVEYENDQFCHLGSVVTNHGWSDWATTEIPVCASSALNTVCMEAGCPYHPRRTS